MTRTPTPSPAPPPGPAAHPWVILVVDDEGDVLESFKALLEESMPGVRVLTATSGRTGIEILERERVDLIMSDFKMPGMDGIEFLVQARRIRPSLPRVMFTAFADDELARKALADAFVSEFLSKGTEPTEMLRRVAQLLKYAP